MSNMKTKLIFYEKLNHTKLEKSLAWRKLLLDIFKFTIIYKSFIISLEAILKTLLSTW